MDWAVRHALGPLVQLAELTASDGTSGDQLGYAVALGAGGTIALVGAPNRNGSRGAAYVFVKSGSTWTRQAELTASDGAADDDFGCSVALNSDGTVALIGAKFHGFEPTEREAKATDARADSTDQGEAYVFTSSAGTWTQSAKLIASDGESNDEFGWSVALDSAGTEALIGAPGHGYEDSGIARAGDSGGDQGVAYVFTKTEGAWTQSAELSASDGQDDDGFGSSVALNSDGTVALVGAPFHSVELSDDSYHNASSDVTDEGAAYVFLRGAEGTARVKGVEPLWTQVSELTPADGAADGYFGASVALSADGTVALIGADTSGTVNPGAAYIFTDPDDAWTQRAELTPSNGASGDYFGDSVSLNSGGTVALVGAWGQTVGSHERQGAAYLFSGSGSSWVDGQELTASNEPADAYFGDEVALNPNATEALVGAPEADQGHAYVFAKPLTKPRKQAITFTGPSPLSYTYGQSSVTVSATGGGSGNPVTFSVSPSTKSGVCSVGGANASTLTLDGAGACVVDANQAAGHGYDAAPEVSETVTIDKSTMRANYAGPQTIHIGKPVALAVKLINLTGGAPVVDASVSLLLGPHSAHPQGCQAISNSTGYASCNLTKVLGPAGRRWVKVDFAGNANLKPLLEHAWLRWHHEPVVEA